MDNRHVGSDFDDYLRDEGLLEEAEAVAAKRVRAALRRRLAERLRTGEGIDRGEEVFLLAEREEEEWQREAAKARKRAQRAGIDQEAIDQAVLAERYDE